MSSIAENSQVQVLFVADDRSLSFVDQAVCTSVARLPMGLMIVFFAIPKKGSPRRCIRYAAAIPAIKVATTNNR